jgi:hypothetical protein
VIGNKKHTHHNRFSLRYSLHLSVEDSSRLLLQFAFLSILIIAPILVLVPLLSCRSVLKVRIVLLRVWALPREVTRLSTIVAGIVVVALRGWHTNARGIRLSWIW